MPGGVSQVPDGARGRCPVCDRVMLLKRDGTLRHHGGPLGSGDFGWKRAYHCNGAGQPPVSDADRINQERSDT